MADQSISTSVRKVESSETHTPVERTAKQKRAGLIQYLALLFSLFMLGWNDGSTGPLLPRIQAVYEASIQSTQCSDADSPLQGIIIGALINVWLMDWLGFGKVLVLGATFQIITYAIQSPAPPFPVFIIFNVVNGVGLALQDALANGFVGSLTYSAATKMGILHAVYGLGAFAAPLVATQFSQMEQWSFHYLTSLGLALCNTIILAVVFRFRRQDACLAEGGEHVHAIEEGKETGKFKQIMSEKTVHFLALFILVYVGVEVTIGGEYLVDVERRGGASSGYISSGFFGGLTLGRVILLPVNKWLDEYRAFYIYAGLSLGYVDRLTFSSRFCSDTTPHLN
ncbi:hypothetical protein NMY22_g1355 [Coprinellus aureogranulatus]|nr:hypothetical protein NMY22_g1355 [Coprinellus aureogranulatus]